MTSQKTAAEPTSCGAGGDKQEVKKKKNDDKIATRLVMMETTTTKESNFPLPLLQIFFFLIFNFIAMLTA